MNVLSKLWKSLATAPAEDSPVKGEHILVVDDEVLICDLFSNYLQKHSFRVTTASTASEALRLLEQDAFSLVTLDIELTDADGLDTLGKIKEGHPKLPVVMVTGLGYDEALFQEALRQKASGYVSKTLPLSQLLMEIRRVLAQAKS